ncbi:hypothetical protein ACFY4B_27540 [Kitasatospora sp. NPDC001261]|uniref:hypothetical protein n=1 Tax=Kitasatospora sp. NPDC001261 TaxID=3364012 RepID=UPI0036A6DA76
MSVPTSVANGAIEVFDSQPLAEAAALLSCGQVDALAALLRTLGGHTTAENFLDSHADHCDDHS